MKFYECKYIYGIYQGVKNPVYCLVNPDKTKHQVTSFFMPGDYIAYPIDLNRDKLEFIKEVTVDGK